MRTKIVSLNFWEKLLEKYMKSKFILRNSEFLTVIVELMETMTTPVNLDASCKTLNKAFGVILKANVEKRLF